MDINSCSAPAGFVMLLESLKLQAHKEGDQVAMFSKGLRLEREHDVLLLFRNLHTYKHKCVHVQNIDWPI